MESLAYLHLALVYESPTAAVIPIWDGKFFESLHRQKRYNVRTYFLLLMVALSVFGLVNETLAQQAALGERGSEVEAIQESLRDRGYFYGRIDSVYGSQTEEAVRRFQQNENLQVDGIVGPETEAALFDRFNSRRRVGRRNGLDNQPEYRRNTTRADLNRRIQQRLTEEGFYFGAIDGVIGSRTQQAIRAFQRYRGLSVTGDANSETLQALGIRNQDDRDSENPYVVAVPGDYNTLVDIRRYVRRATFDDRSRLGSFVNAGAFNNRDSAESLSYRLRSLGFKDARVIYFP